MVNNTEGPKLIPAEDKMDLFVHNLYEGMSIRQAAITAGYTQTHASSNIYRDIKTKPFQDRIQEYATTNDILALPRICKIEDHVLKYLEKVPLDISKFKDTIKQKKQVAGILKPATQEVKHQTINIGQIQAILKADLQEKLGEIEPDVP